MSIASSTAGEPDEKESELMSELLHAIVYQRPENRPPEEPETFAEHQLARWMDEQEAADAAELDQD